MTHAEAAIRDATSVILTERDTLNSGEWLEFAVFFRRKPGQAPGECEVVSSMRKKQRKPRAKIA